MTSSTIEVVITYYVVYIISLINNGLLICAVIKRTPAPLKTYSILILNGAISDLVMCTAEVLYMPRLRALNLGLLVVAQGPCVVGGRESCSMIFSFIMMEMSQVMINITISFALRYHVLIHSCTPSTTKILCILLCAYLPSLYVFLSSYTLQAAPAEAEVLLTTFPEDLRGETVVVYGNVMDAQGIAFLTMALYSAPIHFIIVHILKHKVHKSLDGNDSLTEATRKSHRQLVRALEFHALIPLVNLLSIAVYVTMQYGDIHLEVLEHSSFLLIQITSAISPLVSLYFIRPYREFVTQLFSRTDRKSTPTVVYFRPSSKK